MSVKVRYSIVRKLHYRGTVEVGEDTYRALQEADADDNEMALGEMILDCIDQSDPQDWDIDSKDMNKGTLTVIHQDTGEIVRMRKLSQSEMQGSLLDAA